jgi:tetratricopeptide (TPR) repeat protein
MKVLLKYHFLTFLLLMTFNLKAQENTDLVKSDISTYRQYMNLQWDSLISEVNQYLEKGIDYYYLRARLGVAYYMKQNYVKAIRHFNKALEMNPEDQFTIEYLYYASLFKGDDFEAKLFADKLSPARRQELGIKNRFIEGYSADVTYSFTPDKKLETVNNSSVTGVQQIPNSFTNANLTLKEMPGKRLKLVEGYTFLYKNSDYYNKTTSANDLYSSHILQNQFYASAIYYPARGWQIAGAYHQILVSIPATTSTGNGQGKKRETTYSTLSNYSFSGSLTKSFGYFDLGYTYSGSELNYYKQQQHTFNIGIYPLGNLNLYLLNRFIIQNDETFPGTKSFIAGETFGVKINKHLWAEANLLAGNIRNMSDYGSYIIYNDVNPLKLKSGISLLFPLSSGKIISIRANYASAESNFSDANINNTIKYSSVSITGGISWNL